MAAARVLARGGHSLFRWFGLSVVESVHPERGPAGGGASLVVRGSGVGASRAVSLGASRASARPAEGGSALAALSAASATGAGFVCVGVVSASGSVSWGAVASYLYLQEAAVSSVRPLAAAEGTAVSVGGAHFVVALRGCALVSSGLRWCESRRGLWLPGLGSRAVGSAVSASPSAGVEGGGALVRVVGSVAALAEAGAASCAFGAVSGVRASRVGAGALECRSPARGAGSASVEASESGHAREYTRGGHSLFRWFGLSVVESVHPERGPAGGGASLVVRGSGVGASRAVSLGASRASARPAEGGS